AMDMPARSGHLQGVAAATARLAGGVHAVLRDLLAHGGQFVLEGHLLLLQMFHLAFHDIQ
ncbi:hypothetical protein, partial [Komagataeibacter kakiaceti]|uniref:hypothetical protein n=1 Tax=Komagataeibacter kakiaceti TaxID=943261 RepID=UPI001A7E58F8